VSSGRERSVLVAAGLAQQLQELVLVLRDELSQLRVARAELLQDRLQHLGLLLNDLAELLELGVRSEEVEVAETLLTSSGGGGCHGCGCGISASAGTACTTPSGLCGEIEEVDVVVVSAQVSLLTGRLCSGGLGRCAGGLLLLEVLGDAL